MDKILNRSLNDEEFAIWSSAAEEAWSSARVPDREKMPYMRGHLDCFERVLARGQALDSTPLSPPVFPYYWDTKSDEIETEDARAMVLFKAAVQGGMDPAVAKASIEHLFQLGVEHGVLDEAYNQGDG